MTGMYFGSLLSPVCFVAFQFINNAAVQCSENKRETQKLSRDRKLFVHLNKVTVRTLNVWITKLPLWLCNMGKIQ